MSPLIPLVIIVIGLMVVAIFVTRRKVGSDSSQGMNLLLQQMNELTRRVDERLGESSQKMHESLQYQTTESMKIVRDVTEKLTKLDETNRQVVNFADQLRSLQDILKNPKQRGILGEYYLETILKNFFMGSYQMQYAFTDGTIVDAAIFIKDKIIPIDSKFSLENYNRISETSDPTEKDRLEKLFVADLKNRIAETAKYIKPAERTMDFAFMFIPHEAIYYDLLVNKVGALTDDTESLIQRAANKYKVIIVSPTSFLAYVQTVLQGLKALQIEESAKDIIKRVDELGKHLKSYEEYHDKLGKNLVTVVNHYNSSSGEFKKIDKDVARITGASIEVSLENIEKPLIEN